MSSAIASLGGTDYYDGLIYAVRIYDKELTQSEVSQNYNEGTNIALP